MPKIHVVKTKTIDAPIDQVFPYLNDMNSWMSWSPWLIMEHGVNVTISDDNKYYEWTGKRVGAGNMQITGEEENKSVDYDLTFLKPWKSKAKVKFTLETDGDSTKVSWIMDSSLPFFMFWMVGMMETFIGMDFDRGLTMLKEYIEKGEVFSKLEFKGENQFDGMKYIGIKTTSAMKDLSDSMRSDLHKLNDFMSDKESIHTGFVATIYHDWNMKKGETTYTACVGVKEDPADIPEGFISDEIPASKVYTLRHIGAYHHLGNAWTTLMSMDRGKEFKKNKNFDPFEWYVSDPTNTDEKEIITDICMGVL